MTNAPIPALSSELEELSRAFGRTDIADAAASCRGARDAVLTVALSPASPERNPLLASTRFADARDLGPASFRAVRAERLVLIVGARDTLPAASLDLVDALLRKRPRGGVAVVLTDVDETSAEVLTNLERRAWRTLVKSPPSDPAGLSLSDYNVFLDGEAAEESALRARLTSDRAAFARWLSAPQPAARALDVIALTDLCVDLRDGYRERRGAGPSSSDQDGHSLARKARVRGRMLRRIDEALAEIDRAVSTEIRHVSTAAYAEIGGARFAAAPEAALERAFTAARRRLQACFEGTVRDVDSDLAEALADDLLELGADFTEGAAVRTGISLIFVPLTLPTIAAAPENGTPRIAADSVIAGVAGSIAGVSLARIAMLPIAPLATAGVLAGLAIETTMRARRRVSEGKRKRAQVVLQAAFAEARSDVRATLDEAKAALGERVDAIIDDVETRAAQRPPKPSSSDVQKMDRLLAMLATHATN